MVRLLKRAFDITASCIGLLVLFPLLALLAVVVMLDSPGPPLYLAHRVGRHSTGFRMAKFRTMRVHADRLGPGITTAGDSRITRIGRWLRRTKLDELPQLWNVLLGQMSFVGPRPEDPRYVAFYTPEQRRVLAERPGITSLASLMYRREEAALGGEDWERVYLADILPRKLALDLGYLEYRSFYTDMLIILATVFPHLLDTSWIKRLLRIDRVCGGG